MLREYEKNHFGQNGRRYMRRFPTPSLYSRCVIWAADPDVLKKYLIQDGKFTLDKLLQDISDKNTSVLQGTILPKALKAETQKGNPVLHSEIIDDHTIFLILVHHSILPRLFGYLFQLETDEYEVLCVPIPEDFIWEYHAEHYVKKPDSEERYTNNTHEYRAIFSFENDSVSVCAEAEKFKQLYEKVIQY